jgi:hypothetical protein
MVIKFLQALFYALTPFCRHYWGVPHPDNEKRLVQTCYGCNSTRRVKVSL